MEGSIEAKIMSIVEQSAPGDAKVKTLPTSQDNDLDIRISRPLGDDPSRKHKRSKTVVLRVSREAIEDCFRVSNTALYAFGDVVAKTLAAFDWNHDNPPHLDPPVERLLIKCAGGRVTIERLVSS